MDPGDAIRGVVSAWEKLDADALARLFAADGVYDDPLKPGRLSGREAIRTGNETAMAQLTAVRITLAHVLESEEVGVAEGEFLADMAGGGRLEFPFALVANLAHGEITRLAEYFDTRPLVP